MSLPEGYPENWIESYELKGNLKVTLRPILPQDAPRLQAGYKLLSAQSRYLRFLETSSEMSDAQAVGLATVDYYKKMAFVAAIFLDGEEYLIGVARYASTGEPGVAESAVVVADAFQNRGLGTLMMERLIRYAHSHGVQVLIATFHMTNQKILRLIQKSGFPFEKDMLEPGVWEVRMQINELPEKVRSGG